MRREIRKQVPITYDEVIASASNRTEGVSRDVIVVKNDDDFVYVAVANPHRNVALDEFR